MVPLMTYPDECRKTKNGRYQVYARVNGGPRLYCVSKETPEAAAAFIDRQLRAYRDEPTIEHSPTFEVVDRWA